MSQFKRVKITPQEASLGLDFGTSSSKMTLAHMQRINDQEGVTISRVPISVGLGHPDRFRDGMTNFEFVAFAASVNGRLEFGRMCLDHDTSYPLKTMLTYLAGIDSKAKLDQLPGGRDLIQACSMTSGPGTISVSMIHDVLWRYFEWLRDQALVQATNVNVVIKRLILTYPSYLCQNQEDDDMDKYISLCRKLILPLWSTQDITVHFVSEGQAAALYVCEPIFDSHNTFRRSNLWEYLRDPNESREPLHIAVSDNGSSTLNLQVQSVYFDEEGDFLCSQSNVGQDWRAGTLGGSYLSNDRVKRWIKQAIKEKEWPTGELAVILKRFEEEKCLLDAESVDKDVVRTSTMRSIRNGRESLTPEVLVIGSNPDYVVFISPKQVRRSINAAFDAGIEVLETEVERLLALGQDFAVVLCGGSYCNPGHLRHVQQHLDDIQSRGQKKGVRIKHAVLANFDPSGWQSAVSAGAAISVWPLPSPCDVFLGSSVGRSALGIQRLRKCTGDYEGTFDGFTEVKVLLSVGCHPLSSLIVNLKRKQRLVTVFRLVCHPQYKDERGKTPIKLGKFGNVLNGPIGPYDLDFEFEATHLPPGRFQLSIEGRDAATLASGCRSIREDAIILWIRCCAVTKDGKERANQKDRRWKLVIRTDPATKLLYVDEKEEFLARCQNGRCLGDFQTVSDGQAERCTTCPETYLCPQCYDGMGEVGGFCHDENHDFGQVVVAPESGGFSVEDKFSPVDWIDQPP